MDLSFTVTCEGGLLVITGGSTKSDTSLLKLSTFTVIPYGVTSWRNLISLILVDGGKQEILKSNIKEGIENPQKSQTKLQLIGEVPLNIKTYQTKKSRISSK
jgi:hypothetical protein